MPVLAEIEAQAMELTASLLESLPALLCDDDDGLAEAHRRDAEMDADPSIGITTQELHMALGRLRAGYHLGGKPHKRGQADAR